MIKAFVLSLIFLQVSGCSTVATLSGAHNQQKGVSSEYAFRCDPNYTIPRVYSGVANDLRYLRGEYPNKGVVVFDLPFSFIADTIVLPYTIFTQINHGNLCDKNLEECCD